MKKRSPKKTASEKANRAAPVGNGETANPSGGRSGAAQVKRPRPVWVDDTDAAEMPNFEPSPTLYNCACAFIWDETQRAYFSGDYSLLARAGFADALEFIANPLNAGTDAAAHSEMLEDYRRSMEAKKARADYYKPAKMINANLPRVEFWRKFEAGADKDDDAMEFRRVFLIDRWGGLLRLMPKIRDMGDLDTYNKLTDALIFPAIDTAKNPEPARVRAHWLNHCFSMAGAELARWLSVARLPNFEKQLAELRERIADNFGVFPAPFEYVDADGADVCAPRNVIALAAKIHEHNGNAEKAREARDAFAKIPARYYVRRASDELEILLHIARAQARQMSGGEIGTGANPSGAAADRKPDAGAADRNAANLSGAVIKINRATIQAENLTGEPAPRTGRNVGKVSARVMAGFFGVSISTLKNWENHPKKQRPPIVDGVTYTAAIRENGAGAFMFAERYKDTRRGALKTVGGDKAAAVAEKQAARAWITKNAAELRAKGANLSEWGAG